MSNSRNGGQQIGRQSSFTSKVSKIFNSATNLANSPKLSKAKFKTQKSREEKRDTSGEYWSLIQLWIEKEQNAVQGIFETQDDEETNIIAG